MINGTYLVEKGEESSCIYISVYGWFCYNLPWPCKNKTPDMSYLITLCENRHLKVSLPAKIIQIDQVLTKLCMFRFYAYFFPNWNEKSTN